ncbi:MAG: glycosyltransferase family 39 protein [Acidobacteriota bacterium]|nr:MAG: glycosyltransferase family 39 protein [Acidobacteriota bacterium]
MNRNSTVIIGVLAVAFVAFRLWGLSDQCLWFDEIFSVHAAETAFPGFFYFLAKDLIHPPFFYLLLKSWMFVGGDGLLSLRLFPVVIACLGLIPFIALCRELKLPIATQALALFLIAVNGTLIKYAQEVRMYSLLMTLSLFSLWLFVRLVNSSKGIAVLTVVNILLVHTHYFGWFVVVAEAVVLVWYRREKLVAAKAMFGVTAIAFVPWTIAVANAAAGGSSLGQNIGWMSRPGVVEVFNFAFDVVEPFYYQISSGEPSTLLYISVPMLLLIAAAKLGYFIGEKDAESRQAFYMLGFLAAIPVFVAFAVSWLMPHSIWGSRHLIIVYAPMLILTAIFFTGIRSQKLRIIAVGSLAALTAAAFVVQTTQPRAEYAWCVMDDVSRDAEELGAKEIAVFEDLLAYHLWFENRRAQPDQIKATKVSGVDGINEDAAYFLPRGFDGIGKKDISEVSAENVWLLFRSENLSETEPPLRNFRTRGYNIARKKEYKVTGETVFVVELTK